MIVYTSKDGDTIDNIAWKQYGTRAGRVMERLLDANPGIADYGPVLPAGVTIVIPDLPIPAEKKTIKLWD